MTANHRHKDTLGWKRRCFYALVSLACFLSLLPAIYLAVVNLSPFGGEDGAVLLQSITPYVVLPAYPVLAFALLARRKLLGPVAVVLVVCHLAWTIPQFRPAADVPDTVASAPSVRLFNQNVLYDNPTPEAVAEAIKTSDADFVFLQELSRRDLAVLTSAGALTPYRYSLVKPTNGPDGIGLWSKTALVETEVIELGGEFPALRATTSVADTELELWSIHTRPPPLDGGSFETWRSDLREIRERLHRADGNVIAGGDFNSTWSHSPYRTIATNGYRDAHVATGRGHARSWPAGGPTSARFGGIILIDHVLVRGDLTPKSISETKGNGSDHRGLVADVALT